MLNIANIEFARKRFEKVNNYYGAKGLRLNSHCSV